MTATVATQSPVALVPDKTINYDVVEKEVTEGVFRFAPKDERSVQEQINSLSTDEKACFDALKSKWEAKHPEAPFSDFMYLRFARCSPGTKKFNEKAAWKVMKKFENRYLELTAESLESQLATKTLFPVPGLKSKEGHDVFYMMPRRYFPKKTPTSDIIDNLAYSMNTMVEKEKACTEGIAFLAYMNEWAFENFSVNYCLQFMQMLQGKVPVRVRLFLIVNPPSWFGKIWAIMKPMLSPDFRKKVYMIPESRLNEFLAEGYQQYAPDDMEGGQQSTEQLVQDFITYRKRVESM